MVSILSFIRKWYRIITGRRKLNSKSFRRRTTTRRPTRKSKKNRDRVHLNYATCKILVLGSGNVGKHSIVDQLTIGRFCDGPHRNETSYETALLIEQNNELREHQLNVTVLRTNDVGNPNYRNFARKYHENILLSDAFVLVYSTDSQVSFMSLLELLQDIRKLRGDVAPILMLENKTDLCGSVIPIQNPQWFFLPYGVLVRKVSAKLNEGITEAFETLLIDLDDVRSKLQDRSEVHQKRRHSTAKSVS